eukprot:752190-Hanusia_phi.AAC.8
MRLWELWTERQRGQREPWGGGKTRSGKNVALQNVLNDGRPWGGSNACFSLRRPTLVGAYKGAKGYEGGWPMLVRGWRE